MASDIVYVRNKRPNAVLIRVDGIKYTVERRGSREDSAALPGDWKNKPPVSTFLMQGVLEEISKDAFMALGSRPEETIIEERGRPKRIPGPTDLPLVERAADEVNIPINNPEESREPYIITEADLRKTANLRSPNPAFAGEIPSTEEDIAAIAEAKRLAETNPSQVDFPESETEQLKLQVQELTALVKQLATQQAAAAEAVPAKKTTRKAAAKKPAAKRGRPAKKAGSVSPMSSEGKQELTSKDFME